MATGAELLTQGCGFPEDELCPYKAMLCPGLVVTLPLSELFQCLQGLALGVDFFFFLLLLLFLEETKTNKPNNKPRLPQAASFFLFLVLLSTRPC